MAPFFLREMLPRCGSFLFYFPETEISVTVPHRIRRNQPWKAMNVPLSSPKRDRSSDPLPPLSVLLN